MPRPVEDRGVVSGEQIRTWSWVICIHAALLYSIRYVSLTLNSIFPYFEGIYFEMKTIKVKCMIWNFMHNILHYTISPLLMFNLCLFNEDFVYCNSERSFSSCCSKTMSKVNIRVNIRLNQSFSYLKKKRTKKTSRKNPCPFKWKWRPKKKKSSC